MNPHACYYALSAAWLLAFGCAGIFWLLDERQKRLDIPAWDFFTTFGGFFALWVGGMSLVGAIVGTIAVLNGASCSA